MEKVTYKKVGAPPRNDKIVKNNQSSINLRNCVNGKEIPENENPKKTVNIVEKILDLINNKKVKDTLLP